MNKDDIIRMAREATDHLPDADSIRPQGIVLLALDAGEQAERETIIQAMPGGHSVDPQWVCDAIRARGNK